MDRRDATGAVADLRQGPGWLLDPGRARQHPARRRGRGRGRAGGCRSRLRCRPRRLADHGGGRAHRVHAGFRQADAGGARGGGATDHLGDRQEPRRCGEGVRPHGRLHPRHGRGAEGTGQRQLAVPGRRGHDRPNPPHAPGRGPVHGAIQLPAQRDLRDADPGADHGQHHGLQAAALRRPPVRAAAGGVRRVVPARRDQPRLRPGLGGGAAAPGLRPGQRAVADRLQQDRGPPQEAAAQGAPAARDPGPGRQERGHRPARRRPRARGQGVPAGLPVVQRPALHCAQDAAGAPLGGRAVPGAATARRSPSSRSACRGRRGSRSRPYPSRARSPT